MVGPPHRRTVQMNDRLIGYEFHPQIQNKTYCTFQQSPLYMMGQFEKALSYHS